MTFPPTQITLQLLVELDDVTPLVWRRILIPTNITMAKLHDVLQATMGWTNSHLHAFTVGDERYGMCFDDYPEDEIDENDVAVRKALRGHGRFLYEYDFGDSWSHTVTIESEIPTVHALKYALCLGGENACPPEDVGGSGGYERFLAALADPSHEEHEDYVAWLGEPSFDRRHFSLVDVNAALQSVPQRPRRASRHR